VPLQISWTDPDGFSPARYELWSTFDRGTSWSPVAGDFSQHAFSWMPAGIPGGTAQVELVAFDAEGPIGAWMSDEFEITSVTTGVGDDLPVAFALRLAGSNPAYRGTTLQLAMPASGPARVGVYDVLGALVTSLADGEMPAGTHLLRWDGTARDGNPVGAGLYFVKAQFRGEAPIVRRLSLLR
jgi:hypothetical protein